MTVEKRPRKFLWPSLLVCSVIFVDVPVPFLGSVTRLLGIPIILCVLRRRSRIETPRLKWLAFLVVLFFALPYLAGKFATAEQVTAEIVTNLLFVLAALLAAETIADKNGARVFGGVFATFAAVSGVLAALQRIGVLPPFGRDLWGRATTTLGELRGTGLLSDPNFMAVLLAAAIPLISVLENRRRRVLAFASVALGIYSTDSRAGLILSVVTITLIALNYRHDSNEARAQAARRFAAAAGVVAILAITINVGGQRDRVIDGLSAAWEGQTSMNEVDRGAAISAVDRREYLEAWTRLGLSELPYGAGPNAQQYLVTESGRQNAAHNNFAQLFGMGGLAGLVIGLMTALAAARLFFNRFDELALSAFTIILGGLFLSYPGTILVALPLGVADAIRSRGSLEREVARPERSSSGRLRARR